MQIGFHTDAFNSSYWNFNQRLEWARRLRVPFIECGSIDGVSCIHGLGYQPRIALWEDPLEMRLGMERLGVRFSKLDAAFPLSRVGGATLGVEYILGAMRWAQAAGCPRIDTTDDRSWPGRRQSWIMLSSGEEDRRPVPAAGCENANRRIGGSHDQRFPKAHPAGADAMGGRPVAWRRNRERAGRRAFPDAR